MFKFLITIQPLGFMYGSAGGFLSPENLVGRSGAKFPPDAATLSGLFFCVNKEQKTVSHDELKDNLYIAGPFWAFIDAEEDFYVPLPRHKVISKNNYGEWSIENYKWNFKCLSDDSSCQSDERGYNWLRVDYWDDSVDIIYKDINRRYPSVAEKCWQYVPILHPKMEENQRHVIDNDENDSLFLEYAVQMEEDKCLVYISSYPLENGWYQFGGEGHMVEIKCISLPEDSTFLKRLSKPIKKAFALIAPALWGSNHLSYRYPMQAEFAKNHNKIAMLTDKAVPYRYRIGYGKKKQEEFRTRYPGRLSRGRYAVPAGSVYVLREPLNQTWKDFSPGWFPEEGLLKKFGCGLCLPVDIEGVDD